MRVSVQTFFAWLGVVGHGDFWPSSYMPSYMVSHPLVWPGKESGQASSVGVVLLAGRSVLG